MFYKQDEKKFTDVLSRNKYKEYGTDTIKVDTATVEITCPICGTDVNIPARISKAKAYEIAIKMQGIKLVKKDRPNLGKVFKKTK